MAEQLSPELVDKDSDTTREMRHVLSFTPGKRLCGKDRDMSKPLTMGPVDCIVCIDLFSRMSPEQQDALRRFWGG